MGVIAAFFARLLRMCPGHLFTGFLLIRQEVRAIFKTCNQLITSSCGGADAGDPLLDVSEMVFAFVDRMLTNPEQRAFSGCWKVIDTAALELR